MQIKFLSLTIPGENGTPVQIQAPSGIPASDQVGPFGQTVIVRSLRILFVVAILLAFFYIILAGISWITSGGDKQKVESARKKITFSIIGLSIVFAGYFILSLIGHFFGVTFF